MDSAAARQGVGLRRAGFREKAWANYLKMNARVLADVKVTKRTVTADTAEFEMTAESAGVATTGSAKLVKEDDMHSVEPPLAR